jgi:predicted esterase
MKYSTLFKQTIQLYSEGRYREACELVTVHMDQLKEYASHLYNLRFCTASMAGLTEEAIGILKEAILDQGFWYGYDYLMQEEDIKAIRDTKEFKELAELCRQRESLAKAFTGPELLVIKPEGYDDQKQYPLMMILHGNGQNASITLENWLPCVKEGYLLALAQSSQIEFSGAYVWNDYRKGCSELKEHYDKLVREYNIDRSRVILGGFSAGTRTSLYAALSEAVNVKGLILNGSWLPELAEWEPMFHILKDRGTKLYILCGEKDQISLAGTEQLADILKKYGIEHILHYIEAAGHEYPEDFERYLAEAVQFIDR